MDNEHSADLLALWRQGNQEAAAALFRRYAAQLVALARGRLSAKLAQRIDPEDVVQSAYRSFFADTREGRYQLERGGDLWQLLVAITLHKLNDQVKHNLAQKRAVERERSFGSEDALIASALGHVPSPVEAIVLAEQVELLLRRLEPTQRQMLEMRLQGHALEEIAVAVGCSQRTVIRVLDKVKQLLDEERASETL